MVCGSRTTIIVTDCKEDEDFPHDDVTIAEPMIEEILWL